MSTYGGLNLFGSGPHRITVAPLAIAKKRTAYAGINGLESLTMGGRGRPIRVTGHLRAVSVAALNVILTAIEASILAGSATLIDNWGVNHINVELDSYFPRGPIQRVNGSLFIQHYEVRGVQLV